MKFAKRVFLLAGILGVFLLAPWFFLESAWNEQFPPPITHPEFFYGFTCTVFAWQLVYLLISLDPARYRPMMLLATLAKGSFGVSMFVLLGLGRVPPSLAVGASIDLVFAALFIYAYVAIGNTYDR